jgi:hypothetical protein
LCIFVIDSILLNTEPPGDNGDKALDLEKTNTIATVAPVGDFMIRSQELIPASESDAILAGMTAADPALPELLDWAAESGYLGSEDTAGPAVKTYLEDDTVLVAVEYGREQPHEKRLLAFQALDDFSMGDQAMGSETLLARMVGDRDDPQLIIFNRSIVLVITKDGIDETNSRSTQAPLALASLLPVEHPNQCVDGSFEELMRCTGSTPDVGEVCRGSMTALVRSWWSGGDIARFLPSAVASCGIESLHCLAHLSDDPPLGTIISTDQLVEGESWAVCSPDGLGIEHMPLYQVVIQWDDDRREYPDLGVREYTFKSHIEFVVESIDCGGNSASVQGYTPEVPALSTEKCAPNEHCIARVGEQAMCVPD